MASEILKPSLNKLTQGFSSISHTGYDHDDVPDRRYFASFDGKVTQVINDYENSWIANTPSDPWYPGTGKKRALKTADYGNFLKIMELNTGLTQLAAHFPKNGILVKMGQIVKAGQMIAIPPDSGNDTGNSTGGHTHTEYRNAIGKSFAVQFTDHKPIIEVPVTQEVSMNYEELGRQFETLLKRYSKANYTDFNVFLIDHLGDDGQGGALAGVRNDKKLIALALNLGEDSSTNDIINAINTLKQQSIPAQPAPGSDTPSLPSTNSDSYTVPGFILKKLVFERE